jgi:hypothetical protein
MTGPWEVAFLAVALLACLNAIVTAGLLRRSARLLEAAEGALRESATSVAAGLPVGSRIPRFNAKRKTGEIIESSRLFDERGVLLLVGPSCEPCQRLVADLGIADLDRLRVPIYLVSDEPFPDAETAELNRTRLSVLYQEDDRVSRALDTASTPHAFVFDRGGVIVNKGFPNSFSDLGRLVEVAFGGEVRRQHGAAPARVRATARRE